MVKDEADVVEAFVRHTLAHVNRLVVLENGSSDGSLEILRALEKERLPITILEDPTPGKYHSERMTRLMREHAVERHAADWVLPLDVDEFLAVSAGAMLVSPSTNVDAPLALAWRTYVPDDSDDPLQLNPVLRMGCHLVHGCKAVNVLVPRKLAALPHAVLLRGNHELEIGGCRCPAASHHHAYLAHFPVRSPGQYLAKIVIAALQNEVIPDRDPAGGWHYRGPYQFLKRDPRRFWIGFADAARRYLMLPGEGADAATAGSMPRVETAPFPYRGGPLRYTKPVEDMARAARAVLGCAEQHARRFGLTTKCLDEAGNGTLARSASVIAKLRAQLDDCVDRAMMQEVQLTEKERVIQELAGAVRELSAAVKELSAIKRSWTWRVGRLVVGPLGKLKVLRRKLRPTRATVHIDLAPLDCVQRPSRRPRAPETAVKELYESLSEAQKAEICFEWDYRDPALGVLRTFVANHWQVTRPAIRSNFFTSRQQWLIHDAFQGMLSPEWYPRFMKQLKDDTKGHPWGTNQSIAIFGTPGSDKFQFVITGRHLTLRADGNSEGSVAFGAPIFFGHAASGFHEAAQHPGNIFWPQAQHASKVYQMLDGRHRRMALVAQRPDEPGITFQRTHAGHPGIPVTELAEDQKQELGRVLHTLVEPFRKPDRRRVLQCLEEMGGLDPCTLAFYRDRRSADSMEWDSWRLTGPAFAWYFRGTPHVHVWVHVARNPSVPLNAKSGTFLDPSHDPLQ
jgi:hypothetical protein